ncbi:MAG: NepR family anti-sigma factor [Paracoccus sp. (in: a-proteobacteria)]|uniref:NepR family anti-sigma factor n=1 Tax=Paracoccus sp. TaxID=267 RepID=UPI0026DFF0B9|nr:NepR family anti-sigma factor [Paracoccus sp. (in: a-proteobacteria)]MDO5612596.1 NepR family anti-sigma factor [Paracoccus sp. (in: a-proteobacteria)]
MPTKRDERRRVALEKQIDENLRRTYEQDVQQQVPDKLLQLLQQLREQDQA